MFLNFALFLYVTTLSQNTKKTITYLHFSLNRCNLGGLEVLHSELQHPQLEFGQEHRFGLVVATLPAHSKQGILVRCILENYSADFA